MEHLEWNAAAGFEVRRLPDTAGVAVALLAFELERPWRVIDPQDKQVPLSRPQVPRQLDFERDVAAAVRAERVAVEPGGSAPVGGADDEEDAAPTLQPTGGHLDGARVPADGRAVRNARERTPPGERDDDCAGPRKPAPGPAPALTRILGIELELPGAVEVLPVLPLEVGPRMLGEGDRG